MTMPIPKDIEKILRRGTWKHILALILLVVAMILPGWLLVNAVAAGEPRQAMLGAGIIILLAMIGALVWVGIRRRQHILQTLRKRPQDITWAYRSVLVVGKSKGHVRFHTIEKTWAMFAVRGKEGEEVLNFFASNVPHMTIGWSEANQQRYEHDPTDLQRNPLRSQGIYTPEPSPMRAKPQRKNQ